MNVFHYDDFFLHQILAFKYSATRSIYLEANQFEEKLCEILFFIINKMTPAIGILPWAIYIYFLYFTTALGPDAFELPQPMW